MDLFSNNFESFVRKIQRNTLLVNCYFQNLPPQEICIVHFTSEPSRSGRNRGVLNKFEILKASQVVLIDALFCLIALFDD